MEDQILKLAASQGIWAVLSIVLIFYILKAQEKRDDRQEEREKNYQEIISKLTERFNIVDDIDKNIKEIQYVLKKDK
ncbi:hypothetical protein F3O63_16940 [Clostridium sp. HV4-5-A1G]|uniref:BhlA/UviB family holin-like peptide n=2 Tax=Clostridium sp. HV4-5-A1G TaxID=2004595 RepID=UPI001239A06B|nr:BhlA/UviB family holin-like peptide [Clostridium sp. HV4-5-A1G]KAA8666396.1 hypothetical protein F3O63_16940 [Clostridium sp. HV4-5-A1G]